MRFLRNNGLTLAFAVLFLGTVTGQIFTGMRDYNDDQQDHHQPTVTLGGYFHTGHLWEALGENWESEFLQMGMYVVFASFLFQKGSPESKDPEGDNDVDENPAGHKNDPAAPWPVRAGGWILTLYCNSLSLALFSLFALSFVIHALGGRCSYNDEQASHGHPAVTLLQFMGTSRFWFESLQNWQSEFLSLAVMIVLGVHLRQYGSSQSKPVAMSCQETE